MKKEIVEITSSGIKKILNKYTPERAIAEYVWNGFDAKATEVSIDFQKLSFELDTYESIRISDNGDGISYEELPKNFRKFYESNKSIVSSNSSLTRGKNGYGRFTFHKFANFANWDTTYIAEDGKPYSYQIAISSENLKEYNPTSPSLVTREKGTIVQFSNIDISISSTFINDVLKPFLRDEFAWFLALRKDHKILINGQPLDCSSIVADGDSFSIEIGHGSDAQKFECKYIRWQNKLHDEFSKFYFLNNKLELKETRTTSLNKKGDDFWHSLMIISDFFDNSRFDDDESAPELFDSASNKKVFKDLLIKLNDYLKNKRRPFLRIQASKLIEQYESEKVFPKFGQNDWEKVRKEGLSSFVKELYEVEPSIFMKLNKEQKRIFLELLNLVMDSSERENLFKIIDAVVELDSNDRQAFAKVLETTRLTQVIETINMIKDRLLILENLKELVFNHQLKANERDHLQKFIEKHYWIFGEEYRMICAEEVKFEEALKRYIYLLRGITEKTYIQHPEKYREMDLFLAGTDFRDGKPHNLVIEIKNPTTIKKLSSDEVSQIKKYIDVILKQDEFNDSNEFWSFYLVGQDYDDIVKADIQNVETGLLRKNNNHCLYVKKWSEITNEVERRLKYLLEKLKIERSSLSQKKSLHEILELAPTIKN